MKENTNKKNSNLELDETDIDMSLDIHNDPRRCPGTPVSIRNWPEYDAFPEAYHLCFMRKDKPNDYTEYWKARSALVELKLQKQRE